MVNYLLYKYSYYHSTLKIYDFKLFLSFSSLDKLLQEYVSKEY